jgi:ABC-2 type transport system permease protein
MTSLVSPPDRAARTRRSSPLTGVGTLVRSTLRRDRVRIPVWIGALTVMVLGSAGSSPDVYPTQATRQARAELMSTPAARAIGGPGHGLDDYTYGAMMTEEMLGFAAVFVALMSLLLVVRHTRAEEQAGRAELVRDGVVGRHAPMAAALLIVVAANLTLGGLIAAGLGGLGIDTIDWSGSLLFGAALSAVGITFAGVAAVTAQFSQYSRGASGLAGVALAVAYLLRTAGDMTDGSLSWLSPIGWAQATAAYVDDRWWPLLLNVGLACVLVAVAQMLSTRRDVGAALRPPRPGPPHASQTLCGPLGLALRLQRATFAGWALALLVFGLGYGTLVSELEAFVADNPQLQDAFALVDGADLTETFLATIVSLMATVVAVYALQATLRLRGEETAGHADPVVVAAVPRWQWLASHVTVAVIGAPAVLLLGAFGLGITASAATDDPSLLPQLPAAALAYVPALWLVSGFGVALFGVAPRLVNLVWVVVGYALFVDMLGGLLDLPEWAFDLSPFGIVPLLPVEDAAMAPLAALTGAAAAAITTGAVSFGRRDLQSPT